MPNMSLDKKSGAVIFTKTKEENTLDSINDSILELSHSIQQMSQQLTEVQNAISNIYDIISK